MRTRSQSREQHPPPEEPPVVIEPLRIEYPFQEDPPVEPMADTRTMAQLLQAPTEGSLNSAAGGNFFGQNASRNVYKITESQVQGSSNTSLRQLLPRYYETSTQAVSSDVAELKDIARALL
ncbi:hypothetical protein Tco_0317499 [Tanacetum coccineum]